MTDHSTTPPTEPRARATPSPIVLFIGDDTSSTHIAESLLNRLVGDRVEIHTAGPRPPRRGGREDQMLVMMGLNPSHEERLSVRALNTSDRIIILGTDLDVARVPGRRYEEWDIVTDDLEDRVEALAAELTEALDSSRRSPAGASSSLRSSAQHASDQVRQVRDETLAAASRGVQRARRRLGAARQHLRVHRRRRPRDRQPPT